MSPAEDATALAAFATAPGPEGYFSIQGPGGIHVPAVPRDYAAFVASCMTAAYEAGARQGEDAAGRAAFAAGRVDAMAEIGRVREEALAAGFADCEALAIAMAEAQAAALETGKREVPGHLGDAWASKIASWALNSFALALSTGQHRTDAYDSDRLAAAHRAAGVRPLAARAGRATSPAKAAASRANGRKGGRPKKVTEAT